jgi:hypothetical protein
MAHDKTALVIVALGGLAAMLLSRPSSAATPIVEPGGTDPYAIEPSYQPSDTSSSAPAAIAPGDYASSYDELAAQLTYDVTPAPDTQSVGDGRCGADAAARNVGECDTDGDRRLKRFPRQ